MFVDENLFKEFAETLLFEEIRLSYCESVQISIESWWTEFFRL